MDIEIGDARREEIGAIAVLSAQALTTPWTEPALLAELANPLARFRVARAAGGSSVGYLLAHRIVDELHVLLLAVEPASRRSGIAKALVRRVLDEARATGARVALLEVRAGNEAARALYAGLGFAEVGVRRRYYADGEDAVLLTLELRPGDAAR